MTQSQTTQNTPEINDDEIKAVFDQVIEHLHVQNTLGGFNMDEQASFHDWLKTVQGKETPSLTHPRLSLLASFYGDLAQGDAKDKAKQTIASVLENGHMLNQMAQSMDADLRLFEMSELTPDQAFASNHIAHAVSFGMMIAEQGLDLHMVGGLGIGYEGVFKALEDFDSASGKDKAIEFLFHHAGDDVAAICGVIVASRLAQIPVMIYDQAGMAAVCIMAMIDPILVQNCAFVGPLSCVRKKILEKSHIFTVSSENDVFPGENAFHFIISEKSDLPL